MYANAVSIWPLVTKTLSPQNRKAFLTFIEGLPENSRLRGGLMEFLYADDRRGIARGRRRCTRADESGSEAKEAWTAARRPRGFQAEVKAAQALVMTATNTRTSEHTPTPAQQLSSADRHQQDGYPAIKTAQDSFLSSLVVFKFTSPRPSKHSFHFLLQLNRSVIFWELFRLVMFCFLFFVTAHREKQARRLNRNTNLILGKKRRGRRRGRDNYAVCLAVK